MIEQQRVYRIKDLDSLLGFLREDMYWDLPEASIDDVSFEWTGLDLNLSEDINIKLKGGLIRQLQPFATNQPWGIFVVEFATREVSIITLRQILRCFVAKRRGARPDLPAWQCENLLFICLYGENGFTFAHFKGDKPYSSKLTTFSWHPGEPIRTACEFNLPALVYDDTWTPETWIEEWQKAFDVEKVNTDFYRQIAGFYYRLTGKEGQKRELVLPYVGDDSGSINIYEEFAVRLIGRTIFCWFLKHKESENDVPLIPHEALSLAATQETKNFYHSMLEPLFFEVMNKRVSERKSLSIPRSEFIPFLNGGLFEQHPSDFYPGAANYGLKIPDVWFIDFFRLLERYNFTITENSSIDVDVAVDPEMLGRIFENLLAEVVPETGETARKATGSYYTPRAIVDYMVDQSLSQYLLTKTELGEEKVNRLLDYGEDIEDFSPEEKLAAVIALREIKVIDPACGSGAFPMGILHRMLAVLEKVDPKLELWRAQYLKSLDGIVRQTVEKNISRENWAYIRKLMIIRDSIYGVDIQPIAVEIAKLRCFLSLVVDETVIDSEENRGIEPLPNLEFKFVAANTLVGLPEITDMGIMENKELIDDLATLQKEYFGDSGENKEKIKNEFKTVQAKLSEHYRKLLITEKTDFTGATRKLETKEPTQTQLLAEWDPFSYKESPWFDPKWMFGISDGFNMVIANPPYVDSEEMTKSMKLLREYCSSNYKSAKGNWDLYIPFIELGKKILTTKGYLGYITPNKWLSIGYGKSIRYIIYDDFTRLCRCDKINVFEAGNSPIIIFVGNNYKSNRIVVDEFDETSKPIFVVNVSKSEQIENNLGILLSDNIKLVRKIQVGSNKLSENYVVENPFTTAEAYEIKEIITDTKNNEGAFKFVNTGTIDPYCNLWGRKTTAYLNDKYDYPVVNKAIFKSIFPKRYLQSSKPKIVNTGIRHFESFIDNNGEYIAGKSTLVILKKESSTLQLASLLPILNSRLIKFYIKENYSALGIDGGINFTKPMIEDLPIPQISPQDHDHSIELVNHILNKKASDPFTNTAKYESEIDQFIYELYGLTPEEIAIVEGTFKE